MPPPSPLPPDGSGRASRINPRGTPAGADAGARTAPAPLLLTVPNAVTFARLCAAPAAVWLMLAGRSHAAFWVFLFAGLGDALDGWLARRLDQRSAFGAMLDPVADKALLVSVFVTLAAAGVLPDWLAILVVFRDALILSGIALLALLGLLPAIRPLAVSKLNTALQIGLAGFALLLAGPARPLAAALAPVQDALVWLVAASTALSGAAYVGAVLRLSRPVGRSSRGPAGPP